MAIGAREGYAVIEDRKTADFRRDIGEIDRAAGCGGRDRAGRQRLAYGRVEPLREAIKVEIPFRAQDPGAWVYDLPVERLAEDGEGEGHAGEGFRFAGGRELR